MTCLLAGRALISSGRLSEAVSQFQDALKLRVELGATPERWLDWLAPEELQHRIAWEFLISAYPVALAPHDCLRWFQGLPKPGGVDADRFAAAFLLTEGADCPPTQEVAPTAIERSRTLGLRANFAGVTAIQLQYPSLYVVAAEEMALRGEIPRALELLEGHSSDAEASSVAYDEILASDRALMRIYRRFRLMDEGYRAKDSVLGSEAPTDRLLCMALDSLGPRASDRAFPLAVPGLAELREQSAAAKHASWSALDVWSRDIADTAVTWADQAFANATQGREPEFYDLSCALDVVEAAEIARAVGRNFAEGLTLAIPRLLSWLKRHPTQPVEALTLLMRTWALGGNEVLGVSQGLIERGVFRELIERVGRRRAGTIALEEGELLALRLPWRAQPLLGLAHALLSSCGDSIQAWIARACEALVVTRVGSQPRTTVSLEAATIACGEGLWAQINDLVENGVPIKDRWLRPWLFRVAACIAVERDKAAEAGRIARVAATWESVAPLPAEVANLVDLRAFKAATQAASIGGRDAAPATGSLSFASTRKRPGRSIFESAEIEVSFHMRGELLAQHVIKTPSSDAPYRTIRDQLRQQLLDVVGSEIGLTDLRLQVDPYSAWVPWEALLADPGGRINLPHMRSTLRAPSVPMHPRRAGHLTAHTLTIDHAGADLGGTVWKFIPWTYTHSSLELGRRTDPGDAQILHVVAEPIETRAGLRLRLTSEEFTDANQIERGVTLRSDDILKVLPSIEFCVLQLPLSSRRSRTGVDREKAGLLRSFAAELHLRGLPTIATVPALSFEDAAVLLGGFARAVQVTQETGSSADFMKAAELAISDLFRREIPDRFEILFDICFYGGYQGEW